MDKSNSPDIKVNTMQISTNSNLVKQEGHFNIIYIHLGLLTIYTGISLILRLVLWLSFGISSDVSFFQLPLILFLGALNDFIEFIYLILPFSLLLMFLPSLPSKIAKLLKPVLYTAVFFTIYITIYLSATEYFFFEEFDSRFNLVAVDYLIYPHEVLVNIYESYPVITIVLINIFITSFLFWMFRSVFRKITDNCPSIRDRTIMLSTNLILLSAVIVFCPADLLAHFENRVANQIAMNGLSSFFQSFRTNDLDYNTFYTTMDKVKATYKIHSYWKENFPEGLSDNSSDLKRHIPGNPSQPGKKNIIVIVEESLGADFVGAYGDKRKLTPHFDKLAKKGMLFKNAFATGTRTVRGLEAITLSFPPIPSEAVIKRPGSGRLTSWGNILKNKDYTISFVYGGYAYFDNMKTFYSNNGFEVKDRSNIKNPQFTNIWGVSDGDLFQYSLDYYDSLENRGEPFFSIIMTTSNHKPYTFPSGIEGIKSEGGGRHAGVRYADYALGNFISQAEQHSWYNNTLFIIVADHDARVYGKENIPVNTYRIPILIYSPKIIKPEKIEKRISQMDIAPTVMGILGLEYNSPFFGIDVLNSKADTVTPIFLNHNHDVGMLFGNKLTVLGLNKAVHSFIYNEKTGTLNKHHDDQQLIDLSVAYYQTAFEKYISIKSLP